MSTENQPMETTEQPAAEAAPAVEEKKITDPMEALKVVLQTSRYHSSLARGLREVVKALDRKTAHLCVISKSLDEPNYAKLVTALCKEHGVPLIKVKDSKTLGEWVGLCKYNAETNEAESVVSCSSAVVKRWGEETEARHVLMKYIKSQS